MAAETDNDPTCAPTCRPSPFLSAFLNATLPNGLVDAVCVHSYNNDATPGLLSQTKRQVEALSKAVGALAPDAPIWCGECGPHNEGGVLNVTDGARDGFWYVDALGTLAALGVAEFGRQALAGARYGLLDAARDYEPRPDYYALLLWARLMGPTVLRVAGGDATFHAFAHCAGGAVGLAFVNFDTADRAFDVSFGGRTVAGYDEWHLVPAGDALALNGRRLATAGASLPATAGRRATGPLRVGPRSFGFARFAGTCPTR
jgi:hypothetical protein